MKNKQTTKSKDFKLILTDSFIMHDSLRAKFKRVVNGKTKVIDMKIGDDLFRKTNEWRFIYRLVDKINYWYREIIIDKSTHEVIKDVSESLFDHNGHGSARQ